MPWRHHVTWNQEKLRYQKKSTIRFIFHENRKIWSDDTDNDIGKPCFFLKRWVYPATSIAINGSIMCCWNKLLNAGKDPLQTVYL